MAPKTSPPRSPKGRRRRIARRTATAVTVAALAGAAAVGVVALQPDNAPATAPAAVLRTATVETGNLTTNQQVDGSVVLSATTIVRQRIEGQLASSSATTSAASSNTSRPTSGATPTAGPATAIRTDALDACTTEPTTPTSAQPVDPSSTTSTTVPDTTSTTSTTVPDTTSTTSTLPADQSTSSTDASTTTSTVTDCPDPTSTTVVDTVPDTSTPVGGPTGGGAQPRGGGGASPSAGSTTGSAGSGTGQGSAPARTTQRVTSTIAAGSHVAPGDVLYTVDGTPVVLMIGALPAWRSLSAGVDDGSDITQLEYSLVALGYAPADGVTADAHWDATTTAMVDAWQTGMGDVATGDVALGSVVFLPTSATVSEVTASVGDDVGEGDAILTLAAPTQEVVIDVPEALQASVAAGTVVDLAGTEGTVSLLRTVDRNGVVVVQAVITPSAELTGANGSSISVTISAATDAGSTNVMLVPTEALASRLDGSYVVQVDHGDGTSSWVVVTLVGVDGNTVAIRGDDLTVGASVLLPV